MPIFLGSAVWFCKFLSALGNTQFARSRVEELETLLQNTTVFLFTFNTLSRLALAFCSSKRRFLYFLRNKTLLLFPLSLAHDAVVVCVPCSELK